MVFATVLVISIFVAALYWARNKPYIFVGWCWFFGTLLPVIGLVRVGAQSVADRFTYMPLIGVFMALVWGIGDAVADRRWSRGWKTVEGVVAVLILLACAERTRSQLSYWQNSGTLFSHAVAVTKDNEIAYYSLGRLVGWEGARG